MRRCEDVKMFDRPPLLEEPFAQTLSGIHIYIHLCRYILYTHIYICVYIGACIYMYMYSICIIYGTPGKIAM